MVAAFAMMGCQNLSVPAEVMQHVVHVESGTNPFAIGVVNGQLVRQPKNLDEALATVQMLQDKGYNFSVGLGQVNRNNLSKYGLSTYEDAFQSCPNLVAASRILAECYDRAGGDWGKAFSCYYSGNFVSGYRDGYVQKIYESIRRNSNVNGVRSLAAVQPIQLVGTPSVARTNPLNAAAPAPDSAAYRIAIRSNAIDNVTASAVASSSSASTAPAQAAVLPAASASVAVTKANDISAADNNIFVPTVRGPNDPAAPPINAAVQNEAAVRKTDTANTTHGGSDAAFVF